MADIETVRVTTTTLREGQAPEVSRADYAQDKAGNLWRLYEETAAGSWSIETGEPAELAMPATPRVGDAWVSSNQADAGRGLIRVLSVTMRQATFEVGERGERLTYERGVGLVQIDDVKRGLRIELREGLG